ncbi:MAG: hypothetical protein CV087_05575 [Candidatus Brocadia sp. WS118]|nr:MAG: hypothetical protein CV087_05575 [Candidatus Brocadia sp. WS118]
MLITSLERLAIEILEAGQKYIFSLNRQDKISPNAFYLGNTTKLYNSLDEEPLFLSMEERMVNSYCCGGTGSGKTTLIESIIQDEIMQNRGFCLADAHGDLSEKLTRFLASLWQTKQGKQKEEIARRLILVEPSNPDRIVGFNPLEASTGSSAYSCALEMMNVFKSKWPDFGPRMEELFRTCLVTLSENKLTLLEMPFLLTNKEARNSMVHNLTNQEIKSYWLDRYNKLSKGSEVQYREPVLNKITEFLTDENIRYMLGQARSTLDFRKAMDEGRWVILNIAKGKLKSNASLLGGLFLSKLQLAALSRADIPFPRRRPFHVVLDEFQNFLSTREGADIEVLLSECRKYRVNLTMAHQNLGQLNSDLLNAILGNINTLYCFRLGYRDALTLAPELNPEDKKILSENLIKLRTGEAYVKVRGKPVRLVKIQLPSSPYVSKEVVDEFKESCLSFSSRPLMEVRNEIEKRHLMLQSKNMGESYPLKSKNPLEGQDEW